MFFIGCNFELLEDSKHKSDYKYRRDLEMTIYLTSASYQVQHPEEKNQLVYYHAGLLGGLRAYEAIKASTSMPWRLMDSLLERRAKGTLMEYVHQQANQNCR